MLWLHRFLMAVLLTGALRAQMPADAAAAMEKSMALQRESLAKQVGQKLTGGFFVLPPPAKMGATVPAPATSAPIAADCDPLPTAEVDRLVTGAAQREALDQSLLRAVMQQESGFRPCAVSPKGAMGLMQLMPATAKQMGVQNAFDPASNVDAGAKLLKELLARYKGDVPLALGAYNAGPAKVDAAGGTPDITETQDYIKRILTSLPLVHD